MSTTVTSMPGSTRPRAPIAARVAIVVTYLIAALSALGALLAGAIVLITVVDESLPASDRADAWEIGGWGLLSLAVAVLTGYLARQLQRRRRWAHTAMLVLSSAYVVLGAVMVATGSPAVDWLIDGIPAAALVALLALPSSRGWFRGQSQQG